MKSTHSNRAVGIATALLLCASPCCWAVDKSGVKPSVLSLPTGPGSIEGLGESFEPQLNSGTASYAVRLVAPPGRAGFSPELRLVYDSGLGAGAFGLGWKLDIPYIQRQTEKGLPRYVDGPDGIDNDQDGETDEADETDRIIYSDGEELVPTSDGFFRFKNEQAFVRCARLGQSWEATERNGVKLFFGTNASSRVQSASNQVFRWHLAAARDLKGNEIRYEYSALDASAQRYLTAIDYNGSPGRGMRVAFSYEPRPDVITDYRPCFELKTAWRCTEIIMLCNGARVRSYRLAYQPTSDMQPLSLLASITQVGSDGASTLPPATFEYTAFLGTNAVAYDLPTAPSWALGGDVDLMDINGDGLPDILNTEGSFHTYYLNLGPDTDGIVRWGPYSAMTDAFQRHLSSPETELADIDGDGRAELLDKSGGGQEVQCFRINTNLNWEPAGNISQAGFSLADPQTRLLDLNHDNRTDVLRTGESSYSAWINLGNGRWSAPYDAPAWPGVRFDMPTVHLADMNGDRLQDLVRLEDGVCVYYPNLGYGRFGPGVVMDNAPTGITSPQRVFLLDVNGDGRSDVVYVLGSYVRVWLNLGLDPADHTHGRFADYFSVPSPDADFQTQFRAADVNGNGSVDLLWNTPPYFAFLDFSPIEHPYMLKKIGNGIGKVTTVFYNSTTTDLVRDRDAGKPWPGSFPFPVPVVAQVDVFDGRLSTYTRAMTYHDGYYDGLEREFRGFATAEQRDISNDASAPDLVMAYQYDTGRTNEALKGKPLMIEARDALGGVFYRESNTWQTVLLASGATGETRSVIFAFQSSRLRDVLERGAGSPVQLKWDYAYDTFGNLTNQVEWGRLEAGWDDERVAAFAYTAQYPSGQTNWILNRLVEQLVTGTNGVKAAHKRNYYDNLPLGGVAKGNLTRAEQWIADTDWTTSVRNDYDAFGNITAIYDPLYDLAHPERGHYREIVYDPDWRTFPVQEIIHAGSTNPATLTISAAYNPGFGVVTTSTDFNGFDTYYGYDSFGRLISMTKPPDTFHTVDYEYVLGRRLTNGTVSNWVETRRREEDASGTLDSRLFYDGMGRTIMTRAEGQFPGQVVVTDTVLFNGRKLPWKKYLPYFETNSLDFVEPVYNTGFTEHFYDALGREVRVNQPVGPEGIVFSTTAYAPLTRTVRDEEQTRTNSIHFGCGMRYVEDGLLDKDGKGRLREVYEIVKLTDNGEPLDSPVEWKTAYRYDLLDNLTGYTDSQNNQKFICYDGLGRKTFMDDPDRSWMWYAYDAAGNLIRTRDAKAQEIAYAYDGVNRLLAEYYTTTSEHLGDALTRAQRWTPSPAQLPVRPPEVAYHYDLPYGPLTRYQYWQAGPVASVAMNLLDGAGYDVSADLNHDGTVDASDLVKAAKGGNQADSVTAMNTRGYLSWVQDLSGEEHNSYDERGRVRWTLKRIKDVEATNTLRNFFTAMTYDSQDRVTRLTYPDGTYVFYKYNSRGLLDSVPNVIDRYDYNPAGQNLLLQLACGVTTTYDYDHRLRLTRICSVRQRDGVVLQDLNYEFDGVSNITAIKDGRSNNDLDTIGEELGITSTQARKFNATQSLHYDSLYRLIRASNPAVWGTIEHRYDRIANMILENADLLAPDPVLALGAMTCGGSAGSWGRIGRCPGDQPGPHALTSTTTGSTGNHSSSYDHNGNNIQADALTLSWDSKDRVRGMARPERSACYLYDYTDSRKTKIVGSTNSNDTQVTLYVDKFSEVRRGTFVRHAYVHNGRVASSAAAMHNSGAQLDRGTTYLNDHLLSCAVALDKDGFAREQTSYAPYGYVLLNKPAAGTTPAPYRFTGKEQDDESGLCYVEARYLSVTSARFLSPDPDTHYSPVTPVKTPQLLNPYAYARCNPDFYRDPDGRTPVFAAVAGALISAGFEMGRQFTTTGKVEDWRSVGWEALAGGISGALGVFNPSGVKAVGKVVLEVGVEVGKEMMKGETFSSAATSAIKGVLLGKALDRSHLRGIGKNRDINIAGGSGDFLTKGQKLGTEAVNQFARKTAEQAADFGFGVSEISNDQPRYMIQIQSVSGGTITYTHSDNGTVRTESDTPWSE